MFVNVDVIKQRQTVFEKEWGKTDPIVFGVKRIL